MRILLILLLIFLFSSRCLVGQNEVLINGENIVCPDVLYIYTLQCSCECRLGFINNNMWSVSNGQIIGTDKNTTFVGVIWDNNNLSKSLKVQLNDDVDLDCVCSYQLILNISIINKPILSSPSINHQQICKNDSLVLTTIVNNNKENFIPEFEYCLASKIADDNWYSVNKPSGSKVVLNAEDIPEVYHGENLIFRSYINLCGTEKITSSLSNPIRFLKSLYVQDIDISEISPTCYNGNNGMVKINALTINDTIYNQDNPYKPSRDTIYLLNREQEPIFIKDFIHEIHNFSPGYDTLTFQMKDGRCISRFAVQIPQKPEITLNPLPRTITSYQGKDYHIFCKNGDNGSVTITAENLALPCDLIVMDSDDDTIRKVKHLSEFQHEIHNLKKGKYGINIVDSNLCSAYDTFSLVAPDQSFDFDLIATPLECHNDSTGKIDLFIDNQKPGHPDYVSTIYEVNSSLTSKYQMGDSLHHLFSGLKSGTYIVSITDSLKCNILDSALITQPEPLEIDYNVSAPQCEFDNGRLSVRVSGGNPGYSFQLNDTGAFKPDTLFNLRPSAHKINVKDGNNCELSHIIAIPDLSNPLMLSCEILPPSCSKNDDGKVKLFATGGKGSYVFKDQFNNEIINDSAIFTDLHQNQFYKFTLQDSLCLTDTMLFINSNSDTVRIESLVSNPPTCNGYEDASLNFNIGKGFPDYEIFINSVTYNDTLMLDSNEVSIANLQPGNYSLTVRDDKGCEFTDNVLIIQPEALTVNWEVDNVECYGTSTGSISSNVNGGNGEYTYVWTNENSDVLGKLNFLQNLHAGDYQLMVEDKKHCKQIFLKSLKEGPKLIIKSIQKTDASCNKKSDGSIEIEFLDNFTSYNYKLLNVDDGKMVLSTTGNSDFYYGNLVSGNYLLQVSAGSCDTIIDFQVESGEFLVSVESLANPLCANDTNGYLKLVASNSDRISSNHLFHLHNLNSGWSYSGKMNEFTNLTAGNYEIYVSDKNQLCYSDTLKYEFEQPVEIQTMLKIKDTASCKVGKGEIEVQTNGGLLPHTLEIFQFEKGFQITKKPNEIAPGSLLILVTDANQCVKTDTFFMPVKNKAELLINKLRDYSCDNSSGLIKLIASAGRKYRTTINNRELGYYKHNDGILIYNSGRHELSFVNNHGCKFDTSIYVKLINQMELSSKVEMPSCNLANGSILVQVKGGKPYSNSKPYIYKWHHCNKDTNVLDDLKAGIYKVSVYDSSGCMNQETIHLNNMNAPKIDSLVEKPTYCDLPMGNATVFVSDGEKPYTFKWFDDELNSLECQSHNAKNLLYGKYFIEITDAKDCNIYTDINISQDSSFYVDYSKSLVDSSSCGTNSGSAKLSIQNQTVSVQWTSGSNNFSANNLAGNKYQQFEIIDSNKCVIRDSIFIPERERPTLVLERVSNSYCELPNGSIKVGTYHGTKPYIYFWNYTNDNITSTANDLYAGDYWVYAKDKNGCKSDTGYVKVANTPKFSVNIESIYQPSCSYSTDGKINLNVTNAFQPIVFNWGHEQITEISENSVLAKGKHSVIISDGKGCKDTVGFYMSSPSKLDLLNYSTINPRCGGESNGQIDIWPVGGIGAYKYKWSNGADSKKIENLPQGNYKLVLLDENLCSDTFNFFLEEPDSLIILGINDVYTLCEGQKIEVNPMFNWTEYSWYKNDYLVDTNHSLTITDSANFLLKVVNEKGCKASFEFESIIKNDLLNAEFLIGSESKVGDTLTLIDITWPEADNISWDLPPGIAIINSYEHQCQIITAKGGVYKIGMTAQKAGCSDTAYKTITVYDTEYQKELGNIPVSNSLIQKIKIHPNPTKNNFKVNVSFGEQMNFTLEIINMANGTKYFQQVFTGNKDYEIDLHQPNLPQGVYAVKIITSNEINSYLIVKM